MEVGKDNKSSYISNSGHGQMTQKEKQANFDFRGRSDSSESWKGSKKLYAEFAYSPPKKAIGSYMAQSGKTKTGSNTNTQSSGDFNMVEKLRSMFDDKPTTGAVHGGTRTVHATQSSQQNNQQLLNSQTGQSSKSVSSKTTTRATNESQNSSGDDKHKSNFTKFNLPPHGGSILSARLAKFEQSSHAVNDTSSTKRESLTPKPPVNLEELIKKDNEIRVKKENTTSVDTHSHANGDHSNKNTNAAYHNSNISTKDSTSPLSIVRRRPTDDNNKNSMKVRPSSQEFAGLEENINVYGKKSINIQSMLSPQTSVDQTVEEDDDDEDNIYDDVSSTTYPHADAGSHKHNSKHNGVHDTRSDYIYDGISSDKPNNLALDRKHTSYAVTEDVLPESDFSAADEEGIIAVSVSNVEHAAPSRFFDNYYSTGESTNYTTLNGSSTTDVNDDDNIYEELDAPSLASRFIEPTPDTRTAPDANHVNSESSPNHSTHDIPPQQHEDIKYLSTSEEDDESDDEEGTEGFYSLPPPPSKSCLIKSSKQPANVIFREENFTVVPTYSPWEYDRANMGIDPVTASAEWELEKRVEKMDIYSVDLQKGDRGLGLSIIGLGVGTESGVEKLGIFVKTLTPGGSAQKDGRIQVNDQILEVNNASLVGVTQHFAAHTLKNTSGVVRFLMGRDKGRRHYTLTNSQDVDLQELERRHNEELNDLLNRLQDSEERANELDVVLEDVKLTLAETEERTHIAEGAVEELKEELELVKQSPFVPQKKKKNEIKHTKSDDKKKLEKYEALQTSLKDVSAKLSSSEDSLMKLCGENEEKHTEVQSLREQLQDAEMMCSKLQEENTSLLQDLQTKAKELEESNENLVDSKRDHAELIKHVDAYRERYERLEKQLDESRAHDVGDEMVEKLSEVEQANRDHVNDIEALREKNDRLMQRIRELEKTVGNKETLSLKLAQENDYLQDLVSKLEHSEKEGQTGTDINEYKQLAKQQEDRANALEAELQRMQKLLDDSPTSKKYFNDLDTSTTVIPVSSSPAKVGPKIIKQESVSSSPDTLSTYSLRPIRQAQISDDDDDDDDYENVADDCVVPQTIEQVESGLDFSAFDSLPQDDPESDEQQDKDYINPVPKPPRKVSKEETQSRTQSPIRRPTPDHPPVTEDDISEDTVANVESSFSSDELLDAFDKLDNQSTNASANETNESNKSNYPSVSNLVSYNQYKPNGRLFSDVGDMDDTNIAKQDHNDIHNSTNNLNPKTGEPYLDAGVELRNKNVDQPDASSDPDKRSSFLDSLRQDPNFGTWLDNSSLKDKKGAETSNAEAETSKPLMPKPEITIQPVKENAEEPQSPSALSEGEIDVEGNGIEGRRNTLKLDESYFSTSKRQSQHFEKSPLETSIDDEDGAIINLNDVPTTSTLDTSAQRDKIKVASEVKKRKPSHGSVTSQSKISITELELDDHDGTERTPYAEAATPIGPTSPMSDDSQSKEKSKFFNFHFRKIPGLRKMQKRSSEDHLGNDQDHHRKRKSSREKRHSMYDTRTPATEYSEEDVVPLSAKSEISLQQSLNDAATAEAVVPLHDKLKHHHSDQGDSSGALRGDLSRDEVFSSGASSIGSGTISPSIPMEIDDRPRLDSQDGQHPPRPVIGGPIAHWEQRPVNEWDTRQVGLWLVGMDMNHFVKSFHDRSIDGEQLLQLDGAKLKDLGVYNGDERAKLKKKIKDFKLSVDKDQKGKDARGGKKEGKNKDQRTKKLFWKGRYTVND